MKKPYLSYNKNLKAFSKEHRNNSTLGEVLLWQKLKAGGMMGYKFNRQKPIGKYIVDFYCKVLNLVIEVDGQSHRDKSEYDKAREVFLEAQDLQILRFTEREVRKDINLVLKSISDFIIEKNPPASTQGLPTPLLKGEQNPPANPDGRHTPLYKGELVSAKKHLGQHFLKDENIAKNIADALSGQGYSQVLEIGPGMGVLTKYLLQQTSFKTTVIEIDRESVAYLKANFPGLRENIIEQDFLDFDPAKRFKDAFFAVIGNFPYNISSQILFKVLDHKDQVPEVVGMFQKEVAQRIASPPGNKDYGILSVLLQAWYDIEYLFTVHEHVFSPPPKVKSAVIRLRRNNTQNLGCDEELFKKIVKAGFNQRRKTLRNALAQFGVKNPGRGTNRFLDKRAEQLSVQDFIELTNLVAATGK